jgi:hypothetical protein
LEGQLPICYRPHDLGELLNLARCSAGRRGEQVLRWRRSLTQAERAAVRQHFADRGHVVLWVNGDELRVSKNTSRPKC